MDKLVSAGIDYIALPDVEDERAGEVTESGQKNRRVISTYKHSLVNQTEPPKRVYVQLVADMLSSNGPDAYVEAVVAATEYIETVIDKDYTLLTSSYIDDDARAVQNVHAWLICANELSMREE